MPRPCVHRYGKNLARRMEDTARPGAVCGSFPLPRQEAYVAALRDSNLSTGSAMSSTEEGLIIS